MLTRADERRVWRTTAELATLAITAMCFARIARSEYPAYDVKPTVTEYDVAPNWPQRPPNVSPVGWVSGLAVDNKDQVWLFKKGPDPIQVYKSDGSFVRTWGQGLFDKPHQLRIDHDGNIWVADFGLHIVQKFTPEGKLLQTLGVRGEAGEDETHFNMPTDMAVTPAGDVFISDGYANRRIVHFDAQGHFVKAWGGYGSDAGQFVLPHAIAVDGNGKLYVADRNSGRIEIFDQDGKFLDQWSQLIMPWGLSIKGDSIWVCGSSPHWWMRHGKYPEYKDQLILQFGIDGRVQRVLTLPLGDIGPDKEHPNVSLLKEGHVVGIHCIDVDSQGNVYVGDIYGEHALKLVPVSTRPAEDIEHPSATAPK